MEFVSETRIVDVISSLFLDIVLIVVYVKHSDSHKYVVKKGIHILMLLRINWDNRCVKISKNILNFYF